MRKPYKYILIGLAIIGCFFLIRRVFIWTKIYAGYRNASKSHFEKEYREIFIPSSYTGVLSEVGKEPYNKGFINIDTFGGIDIYYLVALEKASAIIGRSLEIGDTIRKENGRETVTIKWSNTDSMELKLPFYY